MRDIDESKFSTVPLFGLCDLAVAHTKAARNIGPVDVISDLMAKRVLQEVLISNNFTLSKSRMIILLVYLNDFAKKLGSIIINQWWMIAMSFHITPTDIYLICWWTLWLWRLFLVSVPKCEKFVIYISRPGCSMWISSPPFSPVSCCSSQGVQGWDLCDRKQIFRCFGFHIFRGWDWNDKWQSWGLTYSSHLVFNY